MGMLGGSFTYDQEGADFASLMSQYGSAMLLDLPKAPPPVTAVDFMAAQQLTGKTARSRKGRRSTILTQPQGNTVLG